MTTVIDGPKNRFLTLTMLQLKSFHPPGSHARVGDTDIVSSSDGSGEDVSISRVIKVVKQKLKIYIYLGLISYCHKKELI